MSKQQLQQAYQFYKEIYSGMPGANLRWQRFKQYSDKVKKELYQASQDNYSTL